ncbi:MAG TPA: ATP-binding protein [Deltaproteobacteria bacterium]|nr:ATP-binding protein [Deltaproteobacteria bacterium]HQB38111.1 ATP-binding protein [Deltaproteobacteria bacterium]
MDMSQQNEKTGDKVLPRVLVIDDEPTWLYVVAMRLKNCDYEVTTASSTDEAYENMAGQAFDVIITDVVMPGEDGISFMDRVHQSLPDVPVILLTGLSQIEIAVDVIKRGAYDLIHKPVDMEYLCRVTDRAIKFNRLKKLEKNYQEELEATVIRRTAELHHALEKLDVARQQMIRADSKKSEFMSNITHEMRTPMNGVIGALELLDGSELDGSQREFVQLARMSADNMVELIDRLISFATGACHLEKANWTAIDLHELVAGTMERFRERFSMKGLHFECEVAPEVPACIRSDGEQLSLLLDILLNNALKFTDNGHVRISVSTVNFDGMHEAIRISVCDSGIGIPADQVEHIFEPFFQVDGAMTRHYGGAGLGLSIARQIAMLLNGSLWVESELGRGSCFIFLMRLDMA